MERSRRVKEIEEMGKTKRLQKRVKKELEKETICLQCGDRGLTNAFVYCVKCLNFAVHRYCLDVIPKTFDEFVGWICDDCEVKVQNQHAVCKHDAIQCQTRDHGASKHAIGYPGVKTEEPGYADERKRCEQSSSQQLGEEKSKDNPMQHGWDFLRGLSSLDRQMLDEMPLYDLRAQFASYLSKAIIMAEGVLARWEGELKRLDAERKKLMAKRTQHKSKVENFRELKEQLSTLEEKYNEKVAALSTAEVKVVELAKSQEEELKKAREKGRREGRDTFFEVFHATGEGKNYLEAYWQSRLLEYKKSEKFKQVLVGKALKYYYHGIDTCIDQLEAKGITKMGLARAAVDRQFGLQSLPDSDEEEDTRARQDQAELSSPVDTATEIFADPSDASAA